MISSKPFNTKTLEGTLQEHSISLGVKIFLSVTLLAAILLFIYLGYLALYDPETDISIYISIPLILSVLYVCGYSLIRLYKEKIAFTQECLTHTKVYSERRLYYADIKGYKTNKDYYKIISGSPTLKNIEITRWISNPNDFYNFLSDHFVDLDEVEYQEDLDNILEDSLSGTTLNEREQKLRQAKLLCHIINWPGFILMFFLIFLDLPGNALMTIGLLYPLLALSALKVNHLISFDEENNSAHPSIAYGFIMPLLGLVVRVILDVTTLHFQNLWVPSIISFIVILVILLSGKHQFKFNRGKNLATTLFCFLVIYGYCITSVIGVNYVYDTSPKRIYKVKILSKYITTGKYDSYHLILQKWGGQTESENETVNHSLYDRSVVGKPVTVQLGSGLLGAPWYAIK